MVQNPEPKSSRRGFLGAVAGGAIGVVVGAVGGYLARSPEVAQAETLRQSLADAERNLQDIKSENLDLQGRIAQLDATRGELQGKIAELLELQTQPKELDAWIAYGGGSNLKLMPNTEDKNPTVPMDEVFYFETRKAICRVDNNPEAFIMPTHKMGEVVVEPNTFFMLMIANNLQVSKIDSGSITFVGTSGDCFTEAGVGGEIFGSRIESEPFSFEVVAVDGKSFAFTAKFDENEAPLNNAIFGPSFTFTGELKTGSIVVKQVKDLIKTLPT